MEDINLHFTGDIHAIGAANNLLAALLEAHMLQGNKLGIDPLSVTWRRCVDINDRALRYDRGRPRRPRERLRRARPASTSRPPPRSWPSSPSRATSSTSARRLGKITVGYTYEGEPVTAEQLQAAGAMTVLLKDAIMPNLVQTLEGQPALLHCGPFANIAHGNNSLVADPHRAQARRLRGDRVRLRLRHGHGEVPRHRLPRRRAAPERRRPRGDRPGAQAPRRRPRRRCRRDRARRGEPAAPPRDRQGVRPNAVVAINRFPDDTDEEVELVRASRSRAARSPPS